MEQQATAVLERPETEEVKKTPRAKRVWLIAAACLSALLLTTAATFAVHFYLSLQAQQRLSAEQAQQISSLQEALSSQNEMLQSQHDQISSQASEIEKQESIIAKQESTISAQESTISAQESTIKAQSGTIEEQKRKNSTVKKPATTPQATVSTAIFADVDATDLKGKKLVALTFDDGPGPYTARLLDALKARNAKATFFVVGTRVNSYASLIRRMEAEGHVVGNHSQSHKNLKYLSASGIANDMGSCAQKLTNVLGHTPVVMRCPGGNYNNTVKAYAKDAGVPIIQWSMDTRDWESRNKSAILKHTSNVKDGSIVLMHDIYSTTVDAAIEMMDRRINQGYTLVTVPELLKAKYGTVEAGNVYF